MPTKAGPYSSSKGAKTTRHPTFEAYARASHPDRAMLAGTDIFEKVRANGTRKAVTGGDVNPTWGFPAEVSRGRRPKHRERSKAV